jgi:hypothetical protein
MTIRNPFRPNPWKRRAPRAPLPLHEEHRPAINDDPNDMSRLSLNRRLAIAEKFVATHPGRPISALLLDLFPELLHIRAE